MTCRHREHIPPRPHKESPVSKGWGKGKKCTCCKTWRSITQFTDDDVCLKCKGAK